MPPLALVELGHMQLCAIFVAVLLFQNHSSHRGRQVQEVATASQSFYLPSSQRRSSQVRILRPISYSTKNVEPILIHGPCAAPSPSDRTHPSTLCLAMPSIKWYHAAMIAG